MQNVISLENRKSSLATPEDLMTISELANKLGCDKSYIYKLRDKGKLKLYKRGYLKASEKEVIKAMES
jgi:excisionase family DNA binding protein